jgi:hypothetical protein
MEHASPAKPNRLPDPSAAQATHTVESAPMRFGPARATVQQAVAAGAGNAAIARAVGQPLPPGPAARVLGPLAPRVRLHTGPAADARLASRPDALAVTEGTDIHLGSAAPAPDSRGGRLLLAHEAAHVLQQQAAGPAVALARAEAQADEAAVAAVLGYPLPVLSPARGPLYFEARWHQAALTGAMEGAGFTEAEQREAYFANWCRDFSQALVPVLTTSIGPQAAFQLVNLIAMSKFGHGVTPAQLGAYDPRQHIDNPAATTDRDVVNRRLLIAGYPGLDPVLRRQRSGRAAGADAELLSPARIAESFRVNAAGIPEYILRSRAYIHEEVDAALAAGRTREGLFHIGNFSHTTEDLFAHSNWIEMAVGRLLSERQVQLPEGETRDAVQARIEAGRPPVETFAAEVRDQAGNARPILSTGTFSGGGAGHDTLISLKSEAQNLVRDLEPFKEDEAATGEFTDFVIEVLRNVDRASAEGSLGDIIVEVVEQATSGLGPVVAAIVDSLPGYARSIFGSGWLGDLAAGIAELLGDGAGTVADVAGDAWRAGLREAVRAAANSLGPVIRLAEVAQYLKRGVGAVAEAWRLLKEGVRALPDEIEALILPKLVEAEREFKRRLRALANAAYGRAVELMVDGLEGVAPISDAAETNVGVKLEHWRGEFETLRRDMAQALERVGSDEARALAARVLMMTPAEAIGFAESAQFEAVLAGLTDDVVRRVRGAATAMDDKGNQVAQLENVPAWARAGASHSQSAKDHDDSAFFGLGFALARHADGILVGLLQQAWAEAGFSGPAAGLASEFHADAAGQVTDRGINAAERARREAFLATRARGEQVVQEGHAATQDLGPRLVALADALDSVIALHPALRPTLAGLTRLLRSSPDGRAVEALLVSARAAWEAQARSGAFDDATIALVDRALGRLARLVGLHARDERGHVHDADLHHPHEHEGHEHGGRTEVFYGSQIEALDAHRGANAQRADHVRAAVTLPGREERAALEATDAITVSRERLRADIDRLFGHPYDSNWWVALVRGWCDAHPDVLERYVRDRNAGVMHSHVH